MSTQTMYGLTGLLNSIDLVKHDAHVHTFENCISYYYSTEIGVIDAHLLDQLQYSGDIEVYRSFRVNTDLVPDGIYPGDEIHLHISNLSDKPDWLI